MFLYIRQETFLKSLLTQCCIPALLSRRARTGEELVHVTALAGGVEVDLAAVALRVKTGRHLLEEGEAAKISAPKAKGMAGRARTAADPSQLVGDRKKENKN